MRVLHVVPSVAARRGGPAYVALELARSLAAHGVEVTLLATNLDLDAPEEERVRRSLAGVARLELVPAFGPRRLELSLGILSSLIHHLPSVDLVHIHTVFTFPVAVAPLLCRIHAVPYIVRPAGTLDRDCIESRNAPSKRLAMWAYCMANLNHAGAVHATSEKEASELRALTHAARVEVLELGVDAAPLEAVPPDAGERGRAVGSLGRLHPGKRLEVLLRALPLLGPDVELHLAGDGDPAYVATLRRLCDSLGIAARVHWYGHVAGEDKFRFFAACDVLAFPSLHESFGVAVAETLAAGRSVIVSPGVALAGLIESHAAGEVAPAEPAAFARAIRVALDDGVVRARRAEAGEMLARRWSWREVAEKTLALYREILDGRRAP